MDYSSLRIGKQWREAVCKNVAPSVAVVEVDSHNVVPVWCASDKMEYGARTIRTKIQRQLPDFLNEFPVLENPGKTWDSAVPDPVKWDDLINEVTRYYKFARTTWFLSCRYVYLLFYRHLAEIYEPCQMNHTLQKHSYVVGTYNKHYIPVRYKSVVMYIFIVLTTLTVVNSVSICTV
jgi:hypothetical protein